MGVIKALKEALFTKLLSESSLYNQILNSLTDKDEQIYAGEMLARAADKFPNKTALVLQDKSLTYKELYYRSILLSKKLISSGVKPRDKVLMCFENSIEFVVTYFAIMQIGAICVPLNTFLHEKEIEYIIYDAEPSVIIVSNELKHKFQNKTQKFRLLFGSDIDLKTPLSNNLEEIEKGFELVKLSRNELCLLLYTSGTTGVPKGVMLSSKNIITNAVQCSARFGKMVNFTKNEKGVFEANERFFSALPLFHVFAQNTCMWFPLLIGSTIIIVPKIDRRDILEGLLKKPTVFLGVPALYGLLCLMKTAPLDSIKFFVSGGDAMSDKIRTAFAMVYGRKICNGYGLTEAAPVVAVNIENVDFHSHMVGCPVVGLECQVRDKNGEIVKSGEQGSLWIKGDNVMLGYYKSPQETEKVLQKDWLNTGDLAYLTDDNLLAVVGRSKELIIHKGFNIYPQEVENILLSHPSVFKVAVIGREDITSGQVPIAYVALKFSSSNIEKQLRDFCLERLASYKIPRKFICLDDLPMNATGKIDKKQLVSGVK